MSQTLLEMAKDLVLAQIEAHRLSPEEMHTALQHTYTSLQALKAQEDAKVSVAVVTPETPPEPVNWRKSITKHTVTCLECRASFKQLSVRHLREHGLDGRSYRDQVWHSASTTVISQRDHVETEGDRAEVETVGEGSDVSEGTGEGTKGCSTEEKEGSRVKVSPHGL